MSRRLRPLRTSASPRIGPRMSPRFAWPTSGEGNTLHYTMGRLSTNFGRCLPLTGRFPGKFGDSPGRVRSRAKVGRVRPNSAQQSWSSQVRPEFGQMRPRSGQFRPKLAEFGRSSPKVDSIRPKLGPNRPEFGGGQPNSTDPGFSQANSGLKLANFGRKRTQFGRFRPGIDQIWAIRQVWA